MPITPATGLSFSAELDRRSGARRPLRVGASLVLPGGQQMRVRTHDIGLHCITIVLDQNLPPRTLCEVNLDLPVQGEAHALTLRAQVVHGVLSGSGFRLDLSLRETSAADDMVLERFVTQ